MERVHKAATGSIYSSLSSFEFDEVGYRAPHDAGVFFMAASMSAMSQKLRRCWIEGASVAVPL